MMSLPLPDAADITAFCPLEIETRLFCAIKDDRNRPVSRAKDGIAHVSPPGRLKLEDLAPQSASRPSNRPRIMLVKSTTRMRRAA